MLFILSHVCFPPKQSIELMSFFGPTYCQYDYMNIVKYKHSVSMYNMCMNGYAFGNVNRKKMLYYMVFNALMRVLKGS